MPARSFALEKGAEKHLKLAWKGRYKDFQITLDNQPVGSFADQSALKQGAEFTLPDRSKLAVRFKPGVINAGIELTRNGQPIPGSDFDPQQQLGGAVGIIYFIAALNLALGLGAEVLSISILRDFGAGWVTVAFGAVFLLLGVLVQRGLLIALIAAIALFALDGILNFVTAARFDQTPPFATIVLRVLLIIPMLTGFNAIRAMKKKG